MTGIYTITNTENKKAYIGQSSHIEKRWKEHSYELKNNRHPNPYLQNSWNKHGEQAFVFQLIEECTEESLTAREQYWLDHFKGLGETYNIAVCTNSPMKGRKHSEDSKVKISLSNKGKRQSCLNKLMIAEANKTRWIGRKHSEETKTKLAEITRERNSRTHRFIDPEGEIVVIHNLAKFCRENGLNSGHMTQVELGKKNHHKGWKVAPSI